MGIALVAKGERSMTRFVCLILLAFCFVTCVQAQDKQAEDKQNNQDTRGIVPEEFVKARPAKAHAPADARRRPVYRRTSARVATDASAAGYAQLGLTIWRLRPATAADSGARIIGHKT